MQYTIRKIPAALDALIRRRARLEGKSLNAVAVEALAQGLGFGQGRLVRRDLSDIVGTWRKEAAVESAFKAQDRVDKDLWSARREPRRRASSSSRPPPPPASVRASCSTRRRSSRWPGPAHARGRAAGRGVHVPQRPLLPGKARLRACVRAAAGGRARRRGHHAQRGARLAGVAGDPRSPAAVGGGPHRRRRGALPAPARAGRAAHRRRGRADLRGRPAGQHRQRQIRGRAARGLRRAAPVPVRLRRAAAT